jgi:4-hydroxyphenylpyruvate dioxygenase
MELNIPAIKGIGDSLIYLVDRYGPRGNIYDVDFESCPGSIPTPRAWVSPISIT